MKTRRPLRARRRVLTPFLALAVLLTGSCSSSTPNGCGKPPPALGSTINSAFSPLLSVLIQYSRNGAAREGTHPLPPDLKELLQPFFAESTLDRARWTVASDRVGLGKLITSALPRYKAMTLEDTIVFRDREDLGRLDVWIHELSHVEQYEKAGGTRKFARLYLASWDKIELASIERTNQILGQLDSKARQGPPSLSRSCPFHSGEQTAMTTVVH